MRHLTRIVSVPFGVNILGLLEIFALVGALFGMIVVSDYISQSLRLATLVCAAAAIVAFDLWWRRGQPETTWWARLFSPFAGGCFVFVPIWLLFPSFAVAVTIAVLVKNA